MKSFFISNNLPIVYFLGSAIEVDAYFEYFLLSPAKVSAYPFSSIWSKASWADLSILFVIIRIVYAFHKNLSVIDFVC